MLLKAFVKVLFTRCDHMPITIALISAAFSCNNETTTATILKPFASPS